MPTFISYRRRASRRQRLVIRMAGAYGRAVNAGGGRPIPGMAIARISHTVKEYALNWLVEHGDLPQGVHTCPSPCKPLSFTALHYPERVVDFTQLWYDHRAYLADLRRLHGTYWKDFQLGEVEELRRRCGMC